MEVPALTPQQKYRKSEKCKLARERYYETKGKAKAHEYYEKNKEVILNRSKERYNNIKNLQNQENNLGNDLTA
jgi:hypothetical protein